MRTYNGRRQRNIKVALALAAVVFYVTTWAAPYVPVEDDEVLEVVPASLQRAAREIRKLRRTLDRDPGNLTLALQLARRGIEIGRAELDPRFFGYAEAALRPWLDAPSVPVDVVVLAAILKQQRHEFDGALRDLESALQRDPRNAQAWLTSATILQVQGDHARAMAHCGSLLAVRGADFAGAVCLARSMSRSGQAQAAQRLLTKLLERAPPPSDGEELWASTVLAEIAVQLGQREEAERRFGEALSVGLRDAYLLAAYADFLLEQDRPERVVRLLADETEVEGLLLRLAIAERRLQSLRDQRIDSLRGRFAATRRRGEAVHFGEEARFALHVLDEPDRALDLALENWKTQREPRDARIVLEAALAAGDHERAEPVLAALERSSLEDVRLAELSAKLRFRGGRA